MSNLLEQAKEWHLAGHVERAITLYQQVVVAEPQNCDAHNMLGNARADQGNWPEAEQAYRRALAVDAGRASVHYNLGNALFALRQLPDAAACYERAIELDPRFAVAYFNLGNLHYDVRQWNEAAICYRRVLELEPDDPDPDALFNLARALHRLGELEQAVALYRQAVQCMPDAYAACSALAAALVDLQRPQDALPWHRRALELRPDASEAHFHLGRTLLAMGQFDEAEQVLRTALKLDPHDSVIFEALGLLLEMSGKQGEMAVLADEIEQANPDDPRVPHLKAAWTGRDVPDRASDDYVRATFDNFAAQFDSVLEKLEYRAPQLLAQAVMSRYGSGGQVLEVLDAGCGTGLCGPLLQPIARRLVGVDLSGRMLGEARRRNIYDQLIEAELTGYLEAIRDGFDLIVSADTLVYFGDLQPVLAAAAGALRSTGLLAFTLEKWAVPDQPGDFCLQPHGRYCHREAYIQKTLESVGLVLEALDEACLRKQGNQWVPGLVVLARKGAPPT
jgi:predicted TPR repeat methyltransferase